MPLRDREQEVEGIARMMNSKEGKYGCCYIARTRDGHGRFLVCFLVLPCLAVPVIKAIPLRAALQS